MDMRVTVGLLLPFLGTSLGAAMVFFMKDSISRGLQRVLTGFAAGVMVAASFWSLLNPALEGSTHMGKLSFVPAAVGFFGRHRLFAASRQGDAPHAHGQRGRGSRK